MKTTRGIFFNGFETDDVLKKIIDIPMIELPNICYLNFYDFTNLHAMLGIVQLSKSLKWLLMDFAQYAQHINHNDCHGDALWCVINNRNLQHIRVLEIKNLPNLRSLPKNFHDMQTLKEVQIANCINLQILQQEFGNLSNLEVLRLTNCVRLEKVPDSFAKLGSLKKLRLKGCENLIELPVEFGNLHALEYSRFDELCEIGEGARLIRQVGIFEGPSVERV